MPPNRMPIVSTERCKRPTAAVPATRAMMLPGMRWRNLPPVFCTKTGQPNTMAAGSRA